MRNLFFVTPQLGRGKGGLGVSASRIAGHLSRDFAVHLFETTLELPQLTYEEVSPPEGAPSESALAAHLRISALGERRLALQFLTDVLLRHASGHRPALFCAFYAGELAFPVVLTAKLAGTPCALFARGNDLDLDPFGEDGGKILWALERAERVYCVTRELERKISAWVPAARPLYVPNGIDAAAFPLLPPPKHTQGRVTVGLFGELKAKKGLEFLLGNLDFDSFELRIAGALRPELDKFLHGVLTLFPERAIQHLPFASDLPALLRAYSEVELVCLPSLHEGMSNVMLEAMSCGRACVASRVGGACDALEDGVTGFLFDPLDAAGLNAALLRAARDDGQVVGRAAASVRERFTAERERRSYLADLQALV